MMSKWVKLRLPSLSSSNDWLCFSVRFAAGCGGMGTLSDNSTLISMWNEGWKKRSEQNRFTYRFCRLKWVAQVLKWDRVDGKEKERQRADDEIKIKLSSSIKWYRIESKRQKKKKIEYPKSWEDCTWKVSHSSSLNRTKHFFIPTLYRPCSVCSGSLPSPAPFYFWLLFFHLFVPIVLDSPSHWEKVHRTKRAHNQLFISSRFAIECNETVVGG